MFRIEKKDNYFVVTDTTTGIEQIREPRDQIKWKKDVSNDYTFLYNIPNLTAYSDGVIALGIDYKSFAFADIVDSTNTAFASVTALDTFLEQTTGKICCTDSEIAAGSASGVYEGFVVTINALDATKIDISAGRAVWVDFWTNPPNPITYDFSVAAQVGVSVTNLLTSTQSYIGVDYTGTFFQYASRPTNEDGRNVLVLAQLGHADNTTVKSVNDYTSFYDSPYETIRDLIWEFRLINDGNTIFPNGNNLNINKTAGALFGMGINRTNNVKNPNKKANAALTVAPFRYRTQTGGITANVTDIDPTKYDNAGTITNIPAVGTNATNQRVYLFPNNNIVIQYGQTVYSSLALAVQGVQSESFTVFENVAEGAILIGIISVRRDAVHLSNANQAKFIPVSKFGENIGGASGISTSNLQQAYDNSVDPEILTNSTLGAVSFKRGSAVDTDNVIEVQNGAGTVTAKITGDGEMQAEKLSVMGAYSLPTADGTIGQVPQTNGAGVVTWVTVSSGLTVGTTAISGGTNTRVLFQNGGVLQQSAGLQYNPSGNGILQVSGLQNIGGGATDVPILQLYQQMWLFGDSAKIFRIQETSVNNTFSIGTIKRSGYHSFSLNTGGQGSGINTEQSFITVHGSNSSGLNSIANGSIQTQKPLVINAVSETNAGAMLDIRAQGALSTDLAFRVRNSANTDNLAYISGNGVAVIGVNTSSNPTLIIDPSGSTRARLRGTSTVSIELNNTGYNTLNGGAGGWDLEATGGEIRQRNGSNYTLLSGNYFGIGRTPTARLDVQAQGALSTDIAFRVRNSADTANILTVNGKGSIWANGPGFKSQNLIFGNGAAESNINGDYNTILGTEAAYLNVNGNENVYIGFSAARNLDAYYNTHIGVKAGTFIADGVTYKTSGNNNIYIGQNSQALSNGTSNEIVIGQGATGIGSNTATLGNDNITKTQLKGSVICGTQTALATTATDGFLYIPTCAGTPTGVPTAITGKAPIVIDSTNNKMYIYAGGAWVALN